MARAWRIGQVAGLTGLTRRTLRHYDELGLLVPSARSWGDYRLYSEADLLRLLQIQNLKALGLSLTEIGEALADPELDASATLASHLAQVEEQLATLEKLADRLRRLATSSDRNWQDVLSAIALSTELAHPDPNRRVRAALSDTGNTSELLAALRTETDLGVQESLVWSLASRPDAAELALAQLDDPDPGFRSRLVRVLAKAGDPAAAPALCRLLSDPDPRVVFGAVRALGQLGAAGSATELVKLLPSEERLAVEAMEALAAIGPAAVPALVAANQDPRPEVRALVAETLGRIGADAPAAHQGLAEQLAPFLTDPAPQVRVAALMALAELGSVGHEALRRHRDDPALSGLIDRLLAAPQTGS